MVVIRKNGSTNQVTFPMTDNGVTSQVTKDIDQLTPGERAWIISQVKTKA